MHRLAQIGQSDAYKQQLMVKNLIHDLIVFLVILVILLFIKIPYVNSVLAFGILTIYAYMRKELASGLGFKRPTNLLKTIGISLGFAVCMILLSYFILLPIIQGFTGQPINLEAFDQLKGNPNILVTNLALGWIIGGLMEETIFRGFMLSAFMRHLPNRIGILIGLIFSSSLFGYMHAYQGISGQILVGLMGLILGIIYVVYKRNLWFVIFTHGFVNTISMLMVYYDVAKP